MVVSMKTAPASVAARTKPNRPLPFLELSPTQFSLCWLLIELSHLGNAAFALIAAAAHLLLAVPEIYENVSLMWVRRDMLVLAGWSYVVIGVLHIAVFAYDVVRSLRHFQLWVDYFAIDGAFGARGARFEELFHARQLIEVVLQTYQAYQLSQVIPRTWIVHGVVLIMLINGFSAGVIEAALAARQPVLCRTMLLVVDSVADLAIAVVVPIVIILPRILAFDVVASGFPQHLIYNDTWITTAVAEGRQILVTSEIDFVSSLLPHVLWLLGLDTIKAVLLRKSCRVSAGPTLHDAQRPPDEVLTKEKTGNQISISRYLNVLCIMWTIGILAVHVVATARYYSEAPVTMREVCALRVPAWMSTKLPCAVVHLNCHRLHTTGYDNIVSITLAEIDRPSVARLIFSHCSDLHVPPIVAEFSHLRAFMTFNSTVATWNSSAALTSTFHPMLVAMDLILTNFTNPSFPEGIFHSTLPTGINMLLYQSNLSELSDDVATVWGSHLWVSFWIQNTRLRRLPVTFSRLTIRKLVLVGNDIVQLEDDMFATQRPSWIRISNNPLVRLPSSLETPSVLDGLTHVLAENTLIPNVSDTLQAWFEVKRGQGNRFVVSFLGSPVCNTIKNEALCRAIDPSYKDEYRIDLVAPQRPL